MEREELLRVKAKQYAEAQLKVELADRDAGIAKTAAENARLARDRIEKELHDFVGRNQPRKLVMTDDRRAVLIQMEVGATGERVHVTLEQAL